MATRQTPPATPEIWPPAADPAAAASLCADLADILADLAPRPDVLGRGALAPASLALAAIGGNSPYLADLARRECTTLARLLSEGPAPVLADILAELAALAPDLPRPAIAAALRTAKRQTALAVGLADLGGVWPLARITGALSDLADAALAAACAHLLLAAHRAGALALPNPAEPARGSGFAILGMGKLGAQELNYSSDIDLVLLYDPDRVASSTEVSGKTQPEDGGRAIFTRMARDLVALMATRDAGGYVFRTDLRLRPDASATPPAISLPAALSHYESQGEGWERAAMIKARPVAGDMELGQQFLEAIRPFIWRRHLDFAALADLGAMKARIDQHRGSRLPPPGSDPADLAGYDLKLGQGGIREIEFIAQALQMVWGGHDPGLRARGTQEALAALVEAGRLPEAARVELAGAYDVLRTAEHRLQMQADRQTHSLPDKPEALARFAIFLGQGDMVGLRAHLMPHLRGVHARFADLFVHQEILDDTDPEALPGLLKTLGFTNPAVAARRIGGWLEGLPRALRSERARDLLHDLLPALLAALARQPEPDTAFNRFGQFLETLPAGVQLFSLLRENPALLDRVATVLGAAPLLAEHLAAEPSAIEGLLTRQAPDLAPWRTLHRQLQDADGLEAMLAVIRRFNNGEHFRLSLGLLEGWLDVDLAGQARTRLADAAIGVLLAQVMADFAARHGSVPGGGMVVVALGKAGSAEMLPGSDLDLMLIYDHPPGVTESDGPRRLPASTWFLRVAHAFIAALTAPGPQGPLYAVDMRLRPSGNKGPVAVSLAGFARYHAEDAWTWERMALTRARVVAGPSALRRVVRAALAAAIAGPPARPGDPDPAARLRADAAAMRARLAHDLRPSGAWDVKLRPGGLMEVEFIAQTLQLVGARAHPEICHPTTRIALARLAAAGYLPPEDAALLIRADRIWRGVMGLLRLMQHPPEEAPATATGAPSLAAPSLATPALAALARAAEMDPDADGMAGALDVAALRATLGALADQVRLLFIRHIGQPEETDESAGRR